MITRTEGNSDYTNNNDNDNRKERQQQGQQLWQPKGEIAAVMTTKTTKERDSGNKDKLDDNQRERQRLGLE